MDNITAKLGHLFHGGRHFIRARQAAADRGIIHARFVLEAIVNSLARLLRCPSYRS